MLHCGRAKPRKKLPRAWATTQWFGCSRARFLVSEPVENRSLILIKNPYPRPTSTPLAHRFVASYVENWMAPESSARTAFGSMPA